MGKDYYVVLGCDKKATADELKKAYRKLALKWHPDRCPPDKKDAAQKKFQEVGEAFEVLSDPEKRAVYDQVGFDGQQSDAGVSSGGQTGFSGAPAGQHQGPGANVHFTHSNPEDIFRSFFGTSDPFSAFNKPHGQKSSSSSEEGEGGGFQFMMSGDDGNSGGIRMGRMGPGASQGMQYQQSPLARQRKKAPAVNHTLHVNLEELYTGTVKRMRITRRRIDAHGATVKVAAEKEITVKAGWKDGTKITFENEGDDNQDMLPADVIFTLQTRPHATFQRQDDDLIYTCPVGLKDALCGVHTTITTLDNRQLKIDAPNVTPDYIKTFRGEGMPNSKKQRKGDLLVKFRINFPDLTPSQRAQIGEILQTSQNY